MSKENNIDPYDSFLMVPGPTIVDSRVRNAMSNNQMGHLSEEFTEDFVELLKLSKELSKRSTGKTLYILDEPTTGLHFADIEHLLKVLQKLVDAGNTVVIIEHNMDVIKTADHIIDLGPEGGDAGGRVLTEGPPEKIAKSKVSYTGKYLKEYLYSQ